MNCRYLQMNCIYLQIGLFIGVNRPAFGGTVPHFHQMSREISRRPAYFENGIIIFSVAD